MQADSAIVELSGVFGKCGSLDVFLGFAPARLLYSLSFADILDEASGEGYQRPRNRRHSLDFKQYISRQGTSTIPLTFNLRSELSHAWEIRTGSDGTATLRLSPTEKCLAQVDCQHRLGELHDSDVSLAFMTFIGLDLRAEMALFVIINSKAKGLSSSLTDFHESNLLNDLATEAPHLYIARRLNEDPASPWFRLIRYGGETTAGLRRRTSLRMMQKTISKLLNQIGFLDTGGIEDKYALVVSFWRAVAAVFREEWQDHRHHLLTKGVGLYSLTLLLADFVRAAGTICLDEQAFVKRLEPLKRRIDWSAKGTFADAGGQKGAVEVYQKLRECTKT
jgi:DNA sulfur modification protein DndB